MPIGRALLLAAAKSDALNRFATRSRVVRRATRAFMPGERMDDALLAGAQIAASGRRLLYTRLGEALTQRVEAVAVRDHYLDLFEAIQARDLPADVSVKPTQLGLDLSADECLEHTLALAERAERTGAALWIDMEDSSYVDRTLELYRAVRARHARAGLAVQAYLYRTQADVEALFAVAPTLRLVKGAYAEPADVAYAKKRDTDAAYERVARLMLDAAKARRCTPIFGTHDLPLVRRLLGYAREIQLPQGAYEVHMLYGIGERHQLQLRSEGETVATLISYGEAWYRWYMRRLAERPANVGFVLRSMFA